MLVLVATKQWPSSGEECSRSSCSCVPTFHKCPKFCPFENDDARIRMMGGDSLGEVDDEEEASTRTANHVGGVMGGNLERPIGRKAAKKVA